MPTSEYSLLTHKQREVFNAIQAYLAEHHTSPTIKELAEMIEVPSLRSVTQYLEALERKGLISRSRYQRRGITILDGKTLRSETVLLPVVGSAGCDNLSVFADPAHSEFVSVDREFLRGYDPQQTVVVKAIGSSMIDAGIRDGDLVLTEVTKNVETGEKVVVIVDNMAVIKKISFTDNAVILSPMSPDPQYRPIIMRDDFEVSGRVIDVIRGSSTEDEYTYEAIA